MTAAPSRLVHTLDFHKGPVHVCTYNTGSTYLLSGGSDRSIKLSNPSTGTLIKTYSGGHAYEVLSIGVTKDNTKFASCGGDKNVFLWDVTKGEIVRRFGGHLGKVNECVWNENDQVLCTGSFDTTVRLWDVKSSNRLPIQVLQDSKDSITSLVVKDHLIVAGSVDGFLRTWDLRMGQLYKDFFDQPITSLSPSKTSDSLILLSLLSQDSPHSSIPSQPACHHLFDLTLGTSLNQYVSTLREGGYKNSNYRIQSTFSGKSEEAIYGADEEGYVRSWDLETGKEKGKAFKAHERSCLGVKMHPKERRMVSWGQDGLIKIWED
ncbi:WD40 repeat domain-containing protein [Sporobolomyces salmoneus]|uniref:WD40 repeat domain-containing protein n=1 Tax=Sporobolomyces salmoneus TaxID=183962 RepID=UPI00317DA19B